MAAEGTSGSKGSSSTVFQSTPTFPAPAANAPMFGAPTYIPPNNPWQNDNSNKLDIILQKLTKMELNQNTFLTRLNDIEGKLGDTNKKVIEIENSQCHLSGSFDGIQSTTKVNKTDISRLQGEVKNLTQSNNDLQKVNKKMQGDLTDLRCRSMRDNMLFYGVPESISPRYAGAGPMRENVNGANGATVMESTMQSAEGSETDGNGVFVRPMESTSAYANVAKTEENCSELVYEFLGKILKIDNPKSQIQIDRAHRIGGRAPGKIRPIVAKFVLTEHKQVVKAALRNIDLSAAFNGAYKVTDQLPPEVIQRRRELIPTLIIERKKGNTAYLVRDKLYVNNKLVE